MNSNSSAVSVNSASRPSIVVTAAWVGVAAIALVAFYFLFIDSIVRVWSTYKRPEFSHGYLVPLITAWLIWQRRRLIWELRDHGAPTGGIPVAAGIGLALLAHAANIVSLPYLAIPPVLVGLVAVALGWRSARLVAVPTAFLLFGFPLPDTLFVKVSTTLQLLSSQIGAGLLDGLGVPVFLDGNIIDLGRMKLQVAEACSGLRYLLPLLSFGVLCAYIYRAPWWAKLFVVAATLPLTVLLNGARIAMTGLLVEYGNPALAEGFMHLFEGWVVFLIALACLFCMMWLLLRGIGRPPSFVGMLDFERMAGAPDGREPQRSPTAPARTEVAPAVLPRALGATVATLGVAAVLLIPLKLRPHEVPDRPGLFVYPLQLGEWYGTPKTLDQETLRVLGADDYFLADYQSPGDGNLINLWVAYYDSLLQDGGNVHAPTTCLPGAGWEYTSLVEFDTPLRDLSQGPLTVNRGIITKGQERILLYFWLELRGRHATGHEARLYNLWDSLTTGRSDGALIRVFTPLAPGEDATAGDARLLRFLERSYPALSPHVGA